MFATNFEPKSRKGEPHGTLRDTTEVACKVIDLANNKANKSKNKEITKQKMEELGNELNVLEKVKHENIVILFEHFIIEMKVYIFIERAFGGNMYTYLRAKGPFSERKARLLFKQLFGAVEAMHQKNISHRDLKLENILMMDLTDRDLCKVTDFGLSQVHYCEKNGYKLVTSYSKY